MKIAICSIAAVSLTFPCLADDGWVSIFDGETLSGWTNAGGKEVQEGGWKAEGGVLHRAGKSGDLYTANEYGDFEFRWEWKISPKGNSGVKYRVTKYGNANLGPEYQVLDNEHPDGAKSKKRQAGALYDLFRIRGKDVAKPVGEWNSSRVVAKGHHFQHYLNGKLVIDVTVGSDKWKAAHAKSKFKDKPNFATNATGRIFLQDHGDEVWYRKLEIKELKDDSKAWISLFNGKDLNDWTVQSGGATYQIVDDCIMGITKNGSPNTFLTTKKQYENFELKFEVLVHNRLNSGVMVRSLLKDQDKDKYGGRIFGPQVEIEASGQKGAESGYIYGEATGRGWLTPKEQLIPHKLMKDDAWNHFHIIVNGANFKTWINGEQVSDLTDEEIFKTHPKGHIGLQVHGIGRGQGPYFAAWKNIKLKELP